jgi:formate transporter
MEPAAPLYGDAYRPDEIAARVDTLGVAKARAPLFTLLVLGLLAGAYISLGAMLYTVILSGSGEVSGLLRFIGGLGFSLGLILVVVGGAELFTGNNLLAMAWASGRIGTAEVLHNWMAVYAGNVAGCLGTAVLVALADTSSLLQGQVAETALAIASAKTALPWWALLARGVLCNALVCLAVWLAMGGRSVTDKILAILLPISAFVALGFEHSIANWFFLPYALTIEGGATIPLSGVIANLLWVTIGNILGGTLLVAGVYWLAYLRTVEDRPE